VIAGVEAEILEACWHSPRVPKEITADDGLPDRRERADPYGSIPVLATVVGGVFTYRQDGW
jgi:hypothetical protein